MKRFVLFVPALLLAFAACSAQKESSVVEQPSPETIVSTTPPFQTKEPQRYRAMRTITITTPNGETVVTKTWVARDGERRRNESETASKRVIYLDLPDGRFVLLPDEKVYADVAGDPSLSSNNDEDQSEISSERLLHSDSSTSSYQKLGNEQIAGRNSQKYRVVVNSSDAANVSQSETLIWIDEALNMPIRSETSSTDGARVTMELSEIALEVDDAAFRVPEDYEKIAFSELRKRLVNQSE